MTGVWGVDTLFLAVVMLAPLSGYLGFRLGAWIDGEPMSRRQIILSLGYGLAVAVLLVLR